MHSIYTIFGTLSSSFFAFLHILLIVPLQGFCMFLRKNARQISVRFLIKLDFYPCVGRFPHVHPCTIRFIKGFIGQEYIAHSRADGGPCRTMKIVSYPTAFAVFVKNSCFSFHKAYYANTIFIKCAP